MMHCKEGIAGDIFETVDCKQGIGDTELQALHRTGAGVAAQA